MFKRKDFLGIEYLAIFSALFFVGLLISIDDLSSYPIDIPRIYSFKDAKYMITPRQNFYGHLFVFLLFFLPTLFSIYKKCTMRLKAEGKSFKEEFILTLKETSFYSFKFLFYSIIYFGSLMFFVGGTFWLLFKIFV